MHHQATLTEESTAAGRPWHVQCSCGTAGDFRDKESANGYMAAHFARLSGVHTVEFVDRTAKPESVPPPKPAAPKVG